MGCTDSNNATPPAPAIAPGLEAISVSAAAAEFAARGLDPRIRAAVPGWTADAPFFQAGLAGYSDAAMRIVARRLGCPFCVTEALLDRALLGGGHGFDKADLQALRDNVPGGEEDHPLCGQIMGSDPDEMAAAAVKMIEQGSRGRRAYREMAYGEGGLFPKAGDFLGESEHPLCGEDEEQQQSSKAAHQQMKKGEATNGALADELSKHQGFNTPHSVLRIPHSPSDPRSSIPNPHSPSPHPTSDIRHPTSFATIDVNLACPVKKIRSKARGGHWLAEPEGAIIILRAVREAVPREIPCTVKLRRGYDDTPEMARNFERIFDAAYELGYAWATVHARTVEQKYVGPSRWTYLRDLISRRPDRVVFGSGDIWEVGDIFRMIAYTGVHGVSVARGCIGNPWIFRQANRLIAGDPEWASPPTIAEQRDVLEQHFRLSVAVNGELVASRMMRKFGIRFAAHHPRGEEVRKRMIGINSVSDWQGVLGEFYGADAMTARP
ncbi:MAG: tRNA-dihydrouridine synthase family protein [Phycisphaeraceae bacterium]|nr:tRNA-dihydrouridine synthase family protein [Phycisphaeraceae bacterium]